MGRLLFLAGGYSCSWMVTNDPGVTLPPHRGRVSGTQGQRWWVLLLLGTAGPPTPVIMFTCPVHAFRFGDLVRLRGLTVLFKEPLLVTLPTVFSINICLSLLFMVDRSEHTADWEL